LIISIIDLSNLIIEMEETFSKIHYWILRINLWIITVDLKDKLLKLILIKEEFKICSILKNIKIDNNKWYLKNKNQKFYGMFNKNNKINL